MITYHFINIKFRQLISWFINWIENARTWHYFGWAWIWLSSIWLEYHLFKIKGKILYFKANVMFRWVLWKTFSILSYIEHIKIIIINKITKKISIYLDIKQAIMWFYLRMKLWVRHMILGFFFLARKLTNLV